MNRTNLEHSRNWKRSGLSFTCSRECIQPRAYLPTAAVSDLHSFTCTWLYLCPVLKTCPLSQCLPTIWKGGWAVNAKHLVPPMASFSVGIHLKRKMLTLSSWLREPMGEWVMIFYIKQWWSTILLCCHLEYLAQGQWNKERLKEQWTGNDAHITLHALVHENSTYEEATPTLR